MTHFTTEEINMVCLYDPGNRAGTIHELQHMMRCLTPDEKQLKTLAERTVKKLEGMTDSEFDDLSDILTPDVFAEPEADAPDDIDDETYDIAMAFMEALMASPPEDHE